MENLCELGLIGLGVMGRNLALHIADRGHAVAGYDLDGQRVAALRREGQGRAIHGAEDLGRLIELLRTPRAVMLLVPAGAPVDAVIQALLPRLSPGDLVMDAGNSHFRDTDRREKGLSGSRVLYLGAGISGGEEGARRGPSIMAGGPQAAYERVRPILENAAATVDGEPCVAYLGPGSAGHYVKMVHNGIEYGLMELIAESYDLLRRGLGLGNDELHDVFDQWNRTGLESFLIEITARIFCRTDPETQKRLVDVVLDRARQKGTGKWASQDAMELGVPVPTIDAAVAMRDLSALAEERVAAATVLSGPSTALANDREGFIPRLQNALYAGMVLTFCQGMAQLRAASNAYGYGLDLETVARVWRGGCIIRAAALEKIRAAFRARADLANLLLDPALGREVAERQADLREIVRSAAVAGIAAPAFMASLAYLDGYRTARLPTNLIQAQRDYFGAHTYERIDREGTFHTEWET